MPMHEPREALEGSIRRCFPDTSDEDVVLFAAMLSDETTPDQRKRTVLASVINRVLVFFHQHRHGRFR